MRRHVPQNHDKLAAFHEDHLVIHIVSAVIVRDDFSPKTAKIADEIVPGSSSESSCSLPMEDSETTLADVATRIVLVSCSKSHERIVAPSCLNTAVVPLASTRSTR